MGDLETTAQFDPEVAQTPEIGLCCVHSSPLQLPNLNIPAIMPEMNYGYGSTVPPAELISELTVLCVGVGGGLEALQFAYLSRRVAEVIAATRSTAMRLAAARNLKLAAEPNP